MTSAPAEDRPAVRPLRHALGLPAGSVRALLTLLVVGFIVAQTIRGVPLKILWSETLMIVLAHYFTSRRFVQLSPELRERLERSGEIEADGNPLYLPKHTIRTLIIGGFIGLGVYLYREAKLFQPGALEILGTVGAYFLGILFRLSVGWLFAGSNGRAPNWWVDGKAVFTIATVSGTIVIHLLGLGLPFPVEYVENFTLGLVLFYFGSR